MWHPTGHIFGWLALIFASHCGFGILENKAIDVDEKIDKV
jgi:hypothetical protein